MHVQVTKAGCWDVPASTSLYCAVLPEVVWLPCTRCMACCVCTAVCTLLSLTSGSSTIPVLYYSLVYMRNFNPGRVQPGLKVCTTDKRGERLHEDS